MFLFTLMVAVATGILFGLAPAWQGSSTDLQVVTSPERLEAPPAALKCSGYAVRWSSAKSRLRVCFLLPLV